jgi:ABC-2 type transport system ATP-binding protein
MGSKPALRVSGLTKRFGGLTAVDDLSLEVRRGEVFGFLGPNGAGKTTTIKMMCGLLRPDSGTVEIGGRGLVPGSAAARRLIGLSPQNIVVWEMLTCREQLEFLGRAYGLGRAAARNRSRELLSSFGLEEKGNRLAKTLSGGMKRRLNIALALVHEPEILFLDEPQAGLDPQSRVLVRDIIRGQARRATVVLTTHDMEEAEKLSDRVSIIDRGRLLVLDTAAGVKNRLGGGDLIEVEIEEDIEASLLRHLPALCREEGQAAVRGGVLTLVSDEAAALLPEILGAIKARGLRLRALRLRQKTLEDVFIQLTGRGLRE